jgi:hypothetical protein
MSNAVAALPNQLKDAALGNAVATTKLSSRRSRHVLGDQRVDRLML